MDWKWKELFDYVPLLFIGILLLAEKELEKHTFKTSCQLGTTVITLLVFYVMYFRFRFGKYFSIGIAVMAWVLLVYIRKNYWDVVYL